jgi:hypothetical protein
MDYHIDLQMQRYEKYPTWQNKTATFCKKKESAPKLMGHPLAPTATRHSLILHANILARQGCRQDARRNADMA